MSKPEDDDPIPEMPEKAVDDGEGQVGMDMDLTMFNCADLYVKASKIGKFCFSPPLGHDKQLSLRKRTKKHQLLGINWLRVVNWLRSKGR